MQYEVVGPVFTACEVATAGSMRLTYSPSRAPSIAGFCALRAPRIWSKERFSNISTTKCSMAARLAGTTDTEFVTSPSPSDRFTMAEWRPIQYRQAACTGCAHRAVGGRPGVKSVPAFVEMRDA